MFTRAQLILVLVMALRTPALSQPQPVWPLDLETHYLTSNFMERRPGRYHAGLDLKTNSSTGYAVRAVEDGYVSRVRAEAGAYGRAVYVRGVSGRTTVYAHLERFSDRIRQRVEADRSRSGAYRVRLELGPDELAVKAGEVLGMSGQSGTNGPHLHFEVRDAAQRPLDPQAWGFAVLDTFAPVIASVTAHPVRPAPTQAGRRSGPDPQPVARTVVAKAGLGGSLDTLRVAGPVAFSAGITDCSDVRGHRLEPWSIEVRLDGELVYRCRNESFAFSRNNTLRLEWCEVTGRDGTTLFREHWLHRREGVELPGREGGAWYLGPDGRGLAAGVHVLEITATDRSGGRATVSVPLQVWQPRSETAVAVGWSPVAAEVRAGGAGGDAHRLTPFYSEPGSSPLSLRALDPAAGDPVLARTTLAWEPGAAPDDGDWRTQAGLERLGWSARYLAADWPVDGTVRVGLETAAAAADAWVFRLADTTWRPVGPVQQDADGTAWFGLEEPGLHATFRDPAEPWIDPAALAVGLRAERGPAGVTLPRWQTVAVAVVDAGTGVDPATIRAVLDGRPLVVEPDLVRDRVLVTVPDAAAPGDHELVLEASDRAGNRAVRTIPVGLR